MAVTRRMGLIGAIAAGSMMFSSTAAIAATTAPVAQPSPWAVLSVMSGGASAAAVCGAAAAAVAAGQPAAGCVLPQAGTPAPVAGPPQPIPVPPVEGPAGGMGISPLLLGLAAVAAGVALYFLLKKHHHSNSPT